MDMNPWVISKKKCHLLQCNLRVCNSISRVQMSNKRNESQDKTEALYVILINDVGSAIFREQ